jgi:hypothetical protein
MLTEENPIETWEITLPDGTKITDQIEYGYAVTVAGISLVQKRNRRVIETPDGDEEIVPVPENFEENRMELEQLIKDWERAEEIFAERLSKREDRYVLYKRWMEEHLGGVSLSRMLFATAKKMPPETLR